MIIYDTNTASSVQSLTSGLNIGAGTLASVKTFTVTPASPAVSAVTTYTFAFQVPTILRDGDVLNIVKQTDVQFPSSVEC